MREIKSEALKKIILSVILLFVILYVVEIGIRFMYGTIKPSSDWSRIFIPDEELGYKMKPYYQGYFKYLDFNTELNPEFHTNSEGYRDEEFDPYDNIIFMLGDAFVLGGAIEKNNTVEADLQRQLQNTYKVYNLAVPGYTQMQHVVQLEKLIPIYPPQIIIETLSIVDDISDNCLPPLKLEKKKSFYIILKETLKKSRLITLVYSKTLASSKEPRSLDFYLDEPSGAECYAKTKTYLKEIKEL